MREAVRIGSRELRPGADVYVVAELSGNHNGDLGRALALVDAAADAGADAVKLQTYRPESLTIRADTEWFRVRGGTPWDGRQLYDLYAEAATPWEWTAELFERGRKRGIDVFSTPFDEDAIALLEALDPPAHKVASFELPDVELIEAVASTGRPIIMSTGMATLEEIDVAVAAARGAGATALVLLHCNSAYPSPPRDMALRNIEVLRERYGVPVGLSDHTLTDTAATAATALGIVMLEKHLTLERSAGGPDASFSLEPNELAKLVQALHDATDALREPRFGPSESERSGIAFRRSLFVVADVRAGERFTRDNVRSIRPGQGLPPRHLGEVLGAVATRDIERGTPLSWDLVERGPDQPSPSSF